MEKSFEYMREDGQPVSGLYPFRESFYQRLGYAGWVRPLWTKVNAIPFEEMWADDRMWFHHLIARRRFVGNFEFDGRRRHGRAVDYEGQGTLRAVPTPLKMDL